MEAALQTLDIVIPIYNEEAVIASLCARLASVFTEEARAGAGLSRVRFLLIDDGSTDRSAAMIAERIQAGFPAMLLRLSRNFGHQNAVSAGIDHASADLVAIMDADLQDPPELIWQMLQKVREGNEVAYAQRRDRKEGPVRRLGYWAFYRILSLMSDIDIPLDSGDFCLMTRRVVDALARLPERIRVPRVLRAWVGFRQAGVEYSRPERAAGETKYTLRKLYRLATDGMASASTRPLQFAQFLTFFFTILSCLCLMWIVVGSGFFRPEGFTLPILVLLFVLCTGFAVQTFCLYVLGAYLGRAYLEVKGRPPYVIMEVIGGSAPPAK